MICAKSNMVRCVGVIVPGCRKKHNARTSRSPHCPKCKALRFKLINPEMYAYHRLRTRAKERGHEFSITPDQFKEFCSRTLLLEERGKTAHCLSIDRIDPARGYHLDNIQVMTVSENSSKGKRASFGAWNQ